jgi:hypothetical protein
MGTGREELGIVRIRLESRDIPFPGMGGALSWTALVLEKLPAGQELSPRERTLKGTALTVQENGTAVIEGHLVQWVLCAQGTGTAANPDGVEEPRVRETPFGPVLEAGWYRLKESVPFRMELPAVFVEVRAPNE